MNPPPTDADFGELHDVMRRLIDNICAVIVGKEEASELLVVGLLSGGHVLLEDVPGVGKTMMARSLARSVSGLYKRIQFTPDLLPTDITGANIFNVKTQGFEFRQGPVFANVLLADEINRGTPRTQASLLEAMEEGMVTADGETHELPQPFFVIATQNPVEHFGTYPLPEAQLDRFAMRLHLGYPSRQEEGKIVQDRLTAEPVQQLESVLPLTEVPRMRAVLRQVHVAEELRDYAISVCSGTREHRDIRLGASPRASILLVRIAQGLAALAERDYVLPEDVKRAAGPVLSHRIMANPYAGADGKSSERLVREVVNQVPVPVVSRR